MLASRRAHTGASRASRSVFTSVITGPTGLSRHGAGSHPRVFTFPDTPEVGQPARNFITSLLQVDPMCRLTAFDALKHHWLQHLHSLAPAFDSVSPVTALQGPPPISGQDVHRPSRFPFTNADGAEQDGGVLRGRYVGGDNTREGACEQGSPNAAGITWLSPLRGSPYSQCNAQQSRVADDSMGEGQNTPEGIRLIRRPQRARGLLPHSSDEDNSDGSDDEHLHYRRAASGSSLRMARPPAISRSQAICRSNAVEMGQ